MNAPVVAEGLTDDQIMALYQGTEPKNRDPLAGLSHEWILAFARAAIEAALSAAPNAPAYPSFHHPDDSAVDRFAVAMKTKMAAARAKGRGDWDNETICPAERLQAMLRDHVGKGDPVDVGNFAMMLFNRGERTSASVLGQSLLRPAVSATNPLPIGCYCEPGKCGAPRIMGRQTPCRDPQKAAATGVKP